MKKFRILIVEDDLESMERLYTLLKEYESVIDFSSLVQATRYREAQNILLSGRQFDVSILDQNLDEGEVCYSLITKGNVNQFGILVFNTIDKKAARTLENMKVAGKHLVLGKPYNKNNVSTLMNEVNDIVRMGEQQTGANLTHLWIADKQGHRLVKQDNIICVLMNDTLAFFYCFDEVKNVIKLSKTITLSEIMGVLSHEKFQQVNRGALVNIEHIDKINKTDRSIYMRGIETPVIVSETYIKPLDERSLWPKIMK